MKIESKHPKPKDIYIRIYDFQREEISYIEMSRMAKRGSSAEIPCSAVVVHSTFSFG